MVAFQGKRVQLRARKQAPSSVTAYDCVQASESGPLAMESEQATGATSVAADAPKFTTGWCQLPGQKNEDTLAVFRSPALQYDHTFIRCRMQHRSRHAIRLL